MAETIELSRIPRSPFSLSKRIISIGGSVHSEAEESIFGSMLLVERRSCVCCMRRDA